MAPNKKFEASSGTVPADVIWGLVRKSNSFLVKRDGGRNTFSSEPGNVRNLNSFNQSGLANARAIDLSIAKRADGTSGVTMTMKSKAGKRRPAKAAKATPLGRDVNKDFRRVAKCIKATTATYRPDLTEGLLARWTGLHRSLLTLNKQKAGVISKKRSRSGRNK
eukprot:CAMPEP_0114540500 /NCGR_PEP_ID=MMETSP0114-20121206/802_1 /TAXON_ID=31324 /ORGANISM="Goniomonas sp, Strain m" /LENGTH=163 /DNA_ID=CAMNT_0001724669 /DNA_START=33 /DNA_END=524 /DNA_ORIENTATION=+